MFQLDWNSFINENTFDDALERNLNLDWEIAEILKKDLNGSPSMLLFKVNKVFEIKFEI